MRKTLLLAGIFSLMSAFTLKAQVTIGTNQAPNPDAVLELITPDNNKGFLPTRIGLVAPHNPAPLSAHVKGMIVYNTAIGLDSLEEGLYVDDGTRWVHLVSDTLERTATNNTISAQTLGMPIIEIDGDYNAKNDDYVIIANGSSTQNIYLPDATGLRGKVYTIVHQNSGSGNSGAVIINTINNELIKFSNASGSSAVTMQPTFTLRSNSQVTATMQSDGTNWIMLQVTTAVQNAY